MGVDVVECDVHLSADGVPVVIHDHTLDRTTDGPGSVDARTLAQLKQLDAGLARRVRRRAPADARRAARLVREPRIPLSIELKNGPIFYDGLAEQVVELVRAARHARARDRDLVRPPGASGASRSSSRALAAGVLFAARLVDAPGRRPRRRRRRAAAATRLRDPRRGRAGPRGRAWRSRSGRSTTSAAAAALAGRRRRDRDELPRPDQGGARASEEPRPARASDRPGRARPRARRRCDATSASAAARGGDGPARHRSGRRAAAAASLTACVRQLAAQLGVLGRQLGAEQQDQRREVAPGHQRHHRADRAVGLLVVAESFT